MEFAGRFRWSVIDHLSRRIEIEDDVREKTRRRSRGRVAAPSTSKTKPERPHKVTHKLTAAVDAACEKGRGFFGTATAPTYPAICKQAMKDGLFVLPACQDPAAKHPPFEGWPVYSDRWPTDDEIVDWLGRYRFRNGVYITGPTLGRFVVDADSPAAIRWLQKRGMPPTQTLLSSRGRHYHFRYPDFRVKNSNGKIRQKVDIRGYGGVAVACGSIHKTGFVYRWAKRLSPQDVALAKAPEWILDLLCDRPTKAERAVSQPVGPARPFDGVVGPWARAVVDGELGDLAAAEEGCRNVTLARVSFKLGQLAAGGEADRDELLAALHEIALAWENESEAKSRRTIQSCFESGEAHPRSAPLNNNSPFQNSGWHL